MNFRLYVLANLLLGHELDPGDKQSHNDVCQSLIHQLKDGKFTVLGNLRGSVLELITHAQKS